MCNGADEILEVRFEGHIEYKIYGYGDCVCPYLSGGYFYRFNNRIYLDLDPLGEISADHLRVISFLPAEERSSDLHLHLKRMGTAKDGL